MVTLRLFVRAAETGTLSEAAEQSNLALAAASRRIATMEERFGVQLFRRSRHGLSVTPAGAALLESARNLLEQARAIDSEMADFAGGMRGTIRIHTNPSAITQFLPADLAAFAAQRPDLRLDLEENLSCDVVSAVSEGRADLGIVIGGTATGSLETIPYRSDHLALLAPRGMFGDRDSIAFAEVQERDFVGLVNSTALTTLLLEQASRAERVLRLHMQVRSFDGVCRMVEAGFGLGVLPLMAARGFAASMDLDVIALTDAWATRRMLLCLPSGTAPGSAGHALARHLAAFAEKDMI
ncbi:LysR substrate-binding domain-containing protein [Novosphingobium sp. 9]|uniref:LysR family transcriptional regulator n=1 Tax=Novosphingobium sp. 9 TaxID=2025349 RepID=UPI0021B65A4F|nr:LysR substrate-binding domain-containing protein [Novosphingobium sp. 9]